MSPAPPHQDAVPAPARTAPDRRRTSPCAWAVLAILPLLIGLLSLGLGKARGPFWHYIMADPDYTYLFNSLAAAEFQVPTHTDHPGTPVQVFGAVVLRLTHALSSDDGSFRDHVLLNPEVYLWVIWCVLVAIHCAVLLVAGWATLRASGGLVYALLVQLTPVLSLTATQSLYRFKPEPALLTLGVALASGVMLALREGGAPRRQTAVAVLLGVTVGVGVAVKVLFAPLALVPFIALASARLRVIYLASAAAGLALSVLPIVSKLPRVVRWLRDMATHTGHYGTGEAGLVDPSAYADNLWKLLAREPVPLAVAGASLIVCIALPAARAPSWRDPTVRRRWATLLSVVCVQMLLLLAVAKHPHNHSHVTPLSMTGVSLALLLWLLSAGRGARTRGVCAATFLAIGLAAGLGNWPGISREFSHLRSFKREASRTAAFVREPRDGALVQGIGVSCPAWGLYLGDFWMNRRYADDLRRLYPGTLIADKNGISFFGRFLTLGQVMSGSPGSSTLDVIASPMTDIRQNPVLRGLWLTEIQPFGDDTHYKASFKPLAFDPVFPFVGFDAAAGLRDPEGPYPQWGLNSPIRWGLTPESRLTFQSPGGPMKLVLEARRNNNPAQVMTVFLNGEKIYEHRFDRSFVFDRIEVQFHAQQGPNELVFQYAFGDHDPPQHPETGVMFRKLQIVGAGPIP